MTYIYIVEGQIGNKNLKELINLNKRIRKVFAILEENDKFINYLLNTKEPYVSKTLS